MEKVRYKVLYDRRPLLTTFADKVGVRDYVAERVGPSALTEIFLATDDSDDLTRDALPREFVLKASHGCGGVVVVASHVSPELALPDGPQGWNQRWAVHPDRLDWDGLRRLASGFLAQRFGGARGLEWAYQDVPPRILCEELLVEDGRAATDYKFFVFHGKVRLAQSIVDRFGTERRCFYTPDWVPLPVRLNGCGGSESPRPATLEEMISVAERLGEETDFVRVDLYSPGDRVVVGELTNYPAGGTGCFDPVSFDLELGTWWHVPHRYRSRRRWLVRATAT